MLSIGFTCREIQVSMKLKSIQQEIETQKASHRSELEEKDAVIQQLKDAIQEIQALTNSEQKYMKRGFKSQEEARQADMNAMIKRFQRQTEDLKHRLKMEIEAHQSIMDFLSDQRGHMERNVQVWITKYEEDLESKAKELEELKIKRNEDTARCETLVLSYEELEKKVAEAKQLRAIQIEEAKKLAEQEKQAIKIQRWWKKIFEKKRVILILYSTWYRKHKLLPRPKRRPRGKRKNKTLFHE